MELFNELLENLSTKSKRTIVFPEATDVRIVGAAKRLKDDNIIEPILIATDEEIEKSSKESGLDLSEISRIDPTNYQEIDEMIKAFVERRKGKNTEEEAKELMKNNNYFATMLIYMGKADGMISGAIGSTGDTVRPALQIIKTKPGSSRISGAMVMMGPNGERWVFSDIAINISLEADQLAEVAVDTADTAKLFGIDPSIAFLSFSTKGSAKSPEQEKVALATAKAKELAPELNIDGEMQFDAAIVQSVAEKKAPGSPVAGKANVFIFPDLQAGNIGYKIAQRLGKFEAIGPILQGLNAPISDLSRGCSEEDVYKLSVITALQVKDK